MHRHTSISGSLAVSVFGIGLIVSGCGTVGSGDLETEDRSVASFDSLDISDGVNVELVVSPDATPAVSVTYDDNLLDKVVTEVSGDTLRIYFDGSVTSFGGGDRFVSVTVDTIDRIEASGGSDLTGSGEAIGYRLEASGGADVDLSDLAVLEVDLDVSGGADVTVFAVESVTGQASGGADVRVVGQPDRLQVETSGGADLSQD